MAFAATAVETCVCAHGGWRRSAKNGVQL